MTVFSHFFYSEMQLFPKILISTPLDQYVFERSAKKVHGDLNHVLYTIIYEFFDIILDYRFIVGLMTILVSQISVLDFLNRNHTA